MPVTNQSIYNTKMYFNKNHHSFVFYSIRQKKKYVETKGYIFAKNTYFEIISPVCAAKHECMSKLVHLQNK